MFCSLSPLTPEHPDLKGNLLLGFRLQEVGNISEELSLLKKGWQAMIQSQSWKHWVVNKFKEGGCPAGDAGICSCDIKPQARKGSWTEISQASGYQHQQMHVVLMCFHSCKYRPPVPHASSFPGFLCLSLRASFLDEFYIVVSRSNAILQIVFRKIDIFTMSDFPVCGQDVPGDAVFRWQDFSALLQVITVHWQRWL